MKFLNKELIDIFHTRVLKELTAQELTLSNILNALQMVDSKTNPPINFQDIITSSAYSDEDCARGYGPVACRIREHFEVLFTTGILNSISRVEFNQEFEHFFDYTFHDYSEYLTADKELGLSDKKQIIRLFVRWWQNNNSLNIKKNLKFRIDTTFGRTYPRESIVNVSIDEQLKIKLEHEAEHCHIQINNKQAQIENKVYDLVLDYIKNATEHDLTIDYKEAIQDYKNKITDLISKIDWSLFGSGPSKINNTKIVALVNIRDNNLPYVTFTVSNPSYYQDEIYSLSFVIKQPIENSELTVTRLLVPPYVPEQFVSFMTFNRHKDFYTHLQNLLAEQQKAGENDGSETNSES